MYFIAENKQFLSYLILDIENCVSIRMSECAFHESSVQEDEPLQTLSSLESWRTIAAAAEQKGNEKILKLAETLSKNEFPDLKYHKIYNKRFTRHQWNSAQRLHFL